ncbi:MAG: zinc dependent phospholipase C family protein [Caloramator sp.]|nr:zinc dependent phospholipase C family protein [Caloramator sp.]
MGIFENTYSFIFKNILKAVNPLKKKIIKTECEVHKFINNQAVEILKNDKHYKAYNLIINYINEINSGVVWADQDFKSSNHFYNPDNEKGMYGCSNALLETRRYYSKAIKYYNSGNIKMAMFYLGAACHLIQDITVPQHVNVKLLNQHRQYEQWVIKAYKEYENFKVNSGGIYFSTIGEYAKLNSKVALDTYKKYQITKDKNERYYKITSIILAIAQKTTAGLLMKFYRDVKRIEALKNDKDGRKFYRLKIL